MEKYVNTRLLRNSNIENTIELVYHPDLTLEVLKMTPNAGWGFHELYKNPNFTFEWVEHFLDRFWNWNRLSELADLNTVSKYPNFYWNWSIVTHKSSPEEIMKYPDFPWEFNMLSIRLVTEDHLPFLERFQNNIPNWKWVHIARCTRWSVFKKALHLPWMWYISDVKMETEEFLPEDVSIIRELDLLCNWIKLTIYVPIDIINANPDLPWNMEFIQWNKTTWKTKAEPVEKCIREWISANKIKRFWKRAITDPTFKMCRDRLFREFKELETVCDKMSSTVQFFKLREDATIPAKATPGSIGLDLHSVEPYVVFPGQRVVISTGIKAVLPDGVYGRIAPRSGLAVKHGVDIGAGVVDPGDRSEIRVVLFNHDEYKPFVIRPGYRIAQLILEKALSPDSIVELESDPDAVAV